MNFSPEIQSENVQLIEILKGLKKSWRDELDELRILESIELKIPTVLLSDKKLENCFADDFFKTIYKNFIQQKFGCFEKSALPI